MAQIITLHAIAERASSRKASLNNEGSVLALLERLCAFNRIFPETQYEIFGFSGFGDGNVYPVVKQQYVNSAIEALDDEIESFMQSIGFRKKR